MSQCVPSWDLDENLAAPVSLPSHPDTTNPNVPIRLAREEIAELTWKNGQLNMHGHGFGEQPRVASKPETTTNCPNKFGWEKPRAGGTLESIVNQATTLPNNPLTTWFDNQQAATVAASAATAISLTMDATVPERINSGACAVDCSTRIESCTNRIDTMNNNNDDLGAKRENIARNPTAPDWSGRDQSVTASATFGLDSQLLTTQDTFDVDVGSMGSPGNTISDMPISAAPAAVIGEDSDFVSHSKRQREADDDGDLNKPNGKSSISTKRSRAAAIHNQSERKRRDKINQRMKTLQKLVPNSSKTDKASMLDEVIEYLKQLQAQVQMMNRMNIAPMMLPLTMQQQLQMSLMSSMGMGIGMGMGMMDMNTMGRPNVPGLPSVMPSPFMPITWDPSPGDHLQTSPATSIIPDPLSFLSCQPQPMNMEAYTRMTALYQQLQQQQLQQLPQASSSKG